MTWDEISRRPGVTRYWAVRGQIAGADGETPISVKWATAAVRQGVDHLEPRLAEPPSAFTVGLPSAAGAPPERVSTSLVINNQDGALDTYLVGGPTTATEFTSYSLYAFSGQIYEGLVDDNGTTYEREWTPTLVTAGPWSQRDGLITLPLASRDERILGRSKRMVTVRKLRDGTVFGTGDIAGSGWDAEISSGAEAFVDAMLDVDEGLIDTPVPWAYGRAVIPLIRISPSDASPAWYLAWVGSQINEIQIESSWDMFARKDGVVQQVTNVYTLETARSFAVQVDVEDDDGGTFRVWVMGVQLTASAEEPSYWQQFSDFWIVPDWFNPCGLATSSTCSVAKVIELLVTDHSEAGAAGIDSTTFDAADAALQFTSGAVGGLFSDGAAIAEVLHYLGTPWQLGFEIGTDDALRIYVPGWGDADVDLAATDLPTLTHADVYPADDQGRTTWEELGPADAEDRGAPATRVWIDWADDQRDLFPPGNRISFAPGSARVPLTTEVEVRIPGGWIYPPSARDVLTHIGAVRTFATRQVALQTHLWPAAEGTMGMLRCTHDHGLGYDRRLLRILRATVMPAEASARIEAEDVGVYEVMRIGVLDSITHWIRTRPNGSGVDLTTTASSTTVTASSATFDATMVGCSLWTPNAASDGDKSRKITGYISSTSITVDRAYSAGFTATGDAAVSAIDENWIILDNHSTVDGYDFRPDKIRACDETTGLFENDDAGQQFSLR